MKKCVLFLLLVMTVTAVKAQWKFTPEAGMNFTSYDGMEGGKVGARLGIAAEYKLPASSFFSIRSGLYFMQRRNESFWGFADFYDEKNDNYWSQYITSSGFSYVSYYQPGTGENFEFESLRVTTGEANRNYLQLPVLAHFTWNVCKDVNLYAAVGPYIAYGIGGKTRTDSQIWDKNLKWSTEHSEDNVFGKRYTTIDGEKYEFPGQRRFDWGLTGLIGIEVKRINLSMGYDLGYGSPYKGYGFEIKPRYRSGYISIGYSF